ncbi:hypothetical protein BGZ52_012492, partial [Haplosporangium bisporale]
QKSGTQAVDHRHYGRVECYYDGHSRRKGLCRTFICPLLPRTRRGRSGSWHHLHGLHLLYKDRAGHSEWTLVLHGDLQWRLWRHPRLRHLNDARQGRPRGLAVDFHHRGRHHFARVPDRLVRPGRQPREGHVPHPRRTPPRRRAPPHRRRSRHRDRVLLEPSPPGLHRLADVRLYCRLHLWLDP